jgi:hypothetical protein
MAWSIRSGGTKTKPIIPAALFLSLPYAHYTVSRADAVHIAISILPLLAPLLALAMDAPRLRRVLIFAPMLVVSVIITAVDHPGYWYLRGSLTHSVTSGRDRLLVTWYLAAQIRAVEEVARAAGPGQFFAGPYIPGAYAFARRKSPMWEIYMIFPLSPARQQAELRRIRFANIRHALISSERADARADLGLAQTHPLIFGYLHHCLPKARTVPAQPQLTIRWSGEPLCRPNVTPQHTRSSSRSLAGATSR